MSRIQDLDFSQKKTTKHQVTKTRAGSSFRSNLLEGSWALNPRIMTMLALNPKP